MKSKVRSARIMAAGAASLALVLAACSPGSDSSSNTDTDSTASDKTTVTFRLWDDVAAPAYEDSFKEFEKQNDDIDVKVEVVPWGQYWDRLPLDINSGDMADIFWVNSSNFAQYADNGNLIDITTELGDDHDAWVQSVVDLYTRDGKLWGVPQIWDSIALYYNTDLVKAAGVDVNSLKWTPSAGDGDTLLAAAQKLTKDEAGKTADDPAFDAATTNVYGFNAQADMQAIYLPWLGSNGAQLQNEEDQFDFASDKGIESFSYLIDLINKHKVAPSAADTNTNGDITRDLFLQGKLALFQSGPYNLKTIAESAGDIKWGIAPMVEGPEGRVGTVHGVVAVGNEKSENRDATVRVLEWLGSSEGQLPLAEEGIAFPAAVDAQEAFVSYWWDKNVDVSPFIAAAKGTTARPPVGPTVNAGTGAFSPVLADAFLGTGDTAAALKAAQDAGNAAMK
ncbi:MAG: sugar ABC transporter substrate-binding protein [Ancrocorticia sp.]